MVITAEIFLKHITKSHLFLLHHLSWTFLYCFLFLTMLAEISSFVFILMASIAYIPPFRMYLLCSSDSLPRFVCFILFKEPTLRSLYQFYCCSVSNSFILGWFCVTPSDFLISSSCFSSIQLCIIYSLSSLILRSHGRLTQDERAQTAV